ncbi:family 43 glycosylhydrolase [Flavobacterium sp.]|uniref:family 43 glycosylhydrolase n=1 Tax=Flavobacterium sp. TaxID=239 RepID=UPI001B43F3A4|nr:family 43 glycosylhydrolase [Flavobacterium sp.]MBP6182048.1 family 43 glycosylhydrolase [Flavobacterium sp.]
MRISIKKRNTSKWIGLFLALNTLVSVTAQQVSEKKSSKSDIKVSAKKTSAYLFTYFTGNEKDKESIRFAISNDGYNFSALNNNKPIISSAEISSTGGVRDPHILRGVDGETFYMVVTDMNTTKNGWGPTYSMVLLKSKDLINWTSHVVNIPQSFPELSAVSKVWAPQTIFDSEKGKYMIYWSMSFGDGPIKLYYAYTNADFSRLETAPKQLFFSPDDSTCLDGDIIFKDGKYHLFFKATGQHPGIKQAISDKLTEGYVFQDKRLEQTDKDVEGSGIYKLNNSDTWILMYDLYRNGKYQFTKTKDLEHFTLIDEGVTMNFHPRHGTVMPITTAEVERLQSKWGSAGAVIGTANATAIKKINTKIDFENKTLLLSVKPGTNLKAFNPSFVSFSGIQIKPSTSQNFTKGSVPYTISIKGQSPQTWSVTATENHNPVLEGLYADPDIIFAEKTGKFYVYPTSDGFENWTGTYFKTFSSTDLVNWKDEGIILNLPKDVSWGKENAWAPCIIEKKLNGNYKYFYYFCASKKIGVAVSDNPTGPFVDSGKPLIDKYPEGISKGQQIDPDVFTDPQTGKNYLYWGNSYMACAELNDDMVSIKQETIKIITPDASFREGTSVFFRNGTYYFLWSEDDTRSENYKVRYGTSDSPTGKINIPQNNLVIAKDKEAGLFGTGHNSIIQIPGKDEWYIVYHRFNYPNGITMGRSAGYNREVCIDKMEFNTDGSIKPTTPTHQGIKVIQLK